MMQQTMVARGVLSVFGAGLCLLSVAPSRAARTVHEERHFPVKERPLVVLQNIVNGRIEVKSSKNPEVVVISDTGSDKVAVDVEQVGDRLDISASALAPSFQPHDIEANFQLIVPESTELQLRTQTGLIYVEQVRGDMKLQSVAGDVHLKEVSGYIIVKTTAGSLVCTQCAGKLEFNSISGGAQVLQPTLSNVTLLTTTGNLLYDGEFVRKGFYSMNSGRGVVEVHFSGNDSLDLNAHSLLGVVDNQASDFIKPDTHIKTRHVMPCPGNCLLATIGQGLAKVELSSYSGTIRILKRP